jgi:cation diffusion facilitator CzcD-associated flavoprotein CzcO
MCMPPAPEAKSNGRPRRSPEVAIVGAGMSGLCMGIMLKQAGIESFRIWEKASAVGGTWRENTYPGLTCDVPSRFYQYSFAPNPDWSHVYSPGPEIWRYFDRVADRFDLRRHIRFGNEVVGGRFEDGRWRIKTAGGDEATVDFLISACGVLHHPRYPDIEGLDSFSGALFHSARWDHDVELQGRRIAVVGTGSTGVQIVTALAGTSARLLHFQRTPQWIAPVPNRRYTRPTRALFRRFPVLSRLAYETSQAMFEWYAKALIKPGWRRSLVAWLCRRNLARVQDPELRRRLTPDYQPMCKRLVISSGFYEAMQQPNVELVTEAIERVEPRGVVTRDGRLHEVDVIVLATGFDAHAYMRPMDLVGEGGITLDEAWRDGPRAYRTVAIPRFPNLFMLIGPHSPVGNHSLISIAETQAAYVMRWIELWREGRVATMAPVEAATRRFNEAMREAMPSTVWATGCQSWYLGKDGTPEVWPWTPGRHRELLQAPEFDEFEVRPVPAGIEATR